MKIKASEICDKPYSFYKTINEVVEVVYDDGVTAKVTPGVLMMDRVVFSLIKESGYKLPIKHTYSTRSYYENGFFSGGTLSSALETIMKDLIDIITIHHADLQKEALRLYGIMYDITNFIFNETNDDMSTGITSVNIEDLIAITTHPKLKAAIAKAEKEQTGKAIQYVHDVLDDILMNDSKYERNPIAKMYRAGVVNKGQVKQLLGIRGFIIEIDSTIFKRPILSSFTKGLRNIYEMAVESRSAAFALMSSTSSIKQSEYLSRELQLGAMYLEHIYPGDCGTEEYVSFYVTPKSADYKGDLVNLIGAYYKINPDDELKRITSKSTDIVGKTILLRNVLKCKHPDKHGVCATCFGGLAFNIPVKANVGHITTTNVTQAASQALLSTKHHMGSAESGNISIDDITAQIFETRPSGFALKKDIFKRANKITFVIDRQQCNGLLEVKNIATLNRINYEKLSNISEMTVVIETDKGEEVYPCTIVQGNRFGSFTKKFLVHVVNAGIKADDNDNVLLDVTKFRSSAPIIKLQDKEYDFYTLVNEIRSMVKNRNILKGGKSSETPEELLSSLFMLINKKLSINIANISGMIYTFMAKELEKNNFDLGRGSEDPQLISLANAIDRRSASAAMGYNAVTKKLFKPYMFQTSNKPSHPLDALYYKQESIEEYKKKYESV